ncbi:metalloregulator ArsR/SmtB family transcription factor [Brevibacillus sp. SYP-B805]|nr:metalloregulator ArsR/SmtB family transcription factor [Brevibacillus sp. SYP-B805]
MNEKSQMRDVYDAVADPTRRKLLRLLADVEELPLHELTVQFQMGRTAVSKHLAILKDAGLVTSRRVGRETRYRLNAAPLREIQDWVSFYEKFWKDKMLLLNHLLQEEQKMKPVVSLDFYFTSSIEQVWFALTDSTTLAKWIMDNDFKPVVGHKFQFRTEPTQWWNGIVDCEVLEVDEPHKLSYTWVSGSESTTVTWTLKKAPDGTTHLHLEQTGFKEEGQAINGARYGWEKMLNQLEKVLVEL